MSRAFGPLVLDVGSHRGEDTEYYLRRGHRVVAVDANPALASELQQRFHDECSSGQLVVLNVAISDQADREVDFHVSKNPEWSSVREGIANRDSLQERVIRVRTATLADLIEKYGAPYYCKVDIEGMDAIALRSLSRARGLPEFISVETECLDPGEAGNGDRGAEGALETLRLLRGLGYTRFKLVNQNALRVLAPDEPFYTRYDTVPRRLAARLVDRSARAQAWLGAWGVVVSKIAVNRRHRHAFPPAASGPFGPDLDGEWLPPEAAAETLLFHRRDYFRTKNASPIGFWCDWHATR